MFSKELSRNLFVFIFLGIAPLLFSQDDIQKAQKKVYEITEENFVVLLENKDLVMIYFYDPIYPESIKMKSVVEKAQIDGNPFIFTVNISTNLGLRNTFNVHDLPSLVVLKNRKMIYGITGYVDNEKVLADYINLGIKNGSYE